MAGMANRVTILPATSAGQADVQEALFHQPGIGGVQPVGQAADLLEDFLGEFVGIFQVVEFVVLLLALLIAFNSSSITVDERAREHATMFAFGLRPRYVLSMITLESLATGVLGTIIGVAAGYGVLVWIVDALLPNVMPDVGLAAAVSAGTVATAAVLGVVAVGIAPAFTVRRLRRMDVPSTLRRRCASWSRAHGQRAGRSHPAAGGRSLRTSWSGASPDPSGSVQRAGHVQPVSPGARGAMDSGRDGPVVQPQPHEGRA
jgi:putative ABC transport system permease protein